MDLISLFLFTHENNEIKSPTKIHDFTVLFIFILPDLFHCGFKFIVHVNVKLFSTYFIFILFDNGRMTGPLTGY